LPTDLLWIYVGVPAVVVSALVLIKLAQRKAGRSVAERKRSVEAAEETQALPKNADRRGSASKVIADEIRSDSSKDPKPENCANYLGYLYSKKAPDQTHIPSECYNCKMLLRCLYSPNVIEKVYGK